MKVIWTATSPVAKHYRKGRWSGPSAERRKRFEEIFTTGKVDDGDAVAKADRDHRGPHQLAGALVEHLHDALERRREAHGFHKSAKETPMSHTEFVRDVVKTYGVVALAKSMVQDQKSYGLDEFQFVKLATEHAQRVYSNDRPDVAFSKLYQSEESIRRACQVAKATFAEVLLGPGYQPQVVGGEDARDVDDPQAALDAYARLQEIGKQRWPAASEATQFANAFTDPANRELAAKAHRRPAPTTSFPFPR